MPSGLVACDMGRGRRGVEGRSDEVPGDLEHTRVEVTELLEQRGAHVYEVRTEKLETDPITARVVRTYQYRWRHSQGMRRGRSRSQSCHWQGS